jgi:preprotein translocase subunit YajC
MTKGGGSFIIGAVNTQSLALSGGRCFMSFIFSLLAAEPAVIFAAKETTKSQAQSSSTWIMWGLIAVMLVVFYVILIRPQRRRAQEHEQMVQKLTRGDEVVTIGGIHGTIHRLGDDTVELEVDEGVKMTFSRSAIARTLTPPGEDEEEPEEEEELEEEKLEEDEETEELEDEEELSEEEEPE